MRQQPARYKQFLRFALPLGLFCAALITRFWNLGYPNETVFDETYFRVFTSNYLSGSHFFDIHPPFGKLLLAGWASILGYTSSQMDTTAATALRVLPALAGSAIVPVFYLLLRSLNIRRLWAATGASLLLFDGALLVQSRLTLLDSMLILFGLAGLALFAYSRRIAPNKAWVIMAGTGLLMGMGSSIKWTCLAMLGTVWLFHLSDYVRRRIQLSLKSAALSVLTLAILPATIYVCSFLVHFSVLTNTGDGDAFMPTQFQATLNGSPYFQPDAKVSFWQKFYWANKEMYDANRRQFTQHPYQSTWYSWPAMWRPISYWFGSFADGRNGRIYLFGNPVVWWGSSLAVLAVLALMALRWRKWPPKRLHFGLVLLLVAYAVNYLPFSQITRPMFLYHYLFAMALAVALGMLALEAAPMNARRRTMVATTIIGIAAASFLFFSPLMYGGELTEAQYHLRLWLPSWQ